MNYWNETFLNYHQIFLLLLLGFGLLVGWTSSAGEKCNR